MLTSIVGWVKIWEFYVHSGRYTYQKKTVIITVTATGQGLDDAQLVIWFNHPASQPASQPISAANLEGLDRDSSKLSYVGQTPL